MSQFRIRHDGQSLKPVDVSRMLADLPIDDGSEDGETVMRHMVALESLDARGEQYRGQAFDVMGAALQYATTYKTHAHCKHHGCRELGTFQPHPEHPHILFCDRHASWLFARTFAASE